MDVVYIYIYINICNIQNHTDRQKTKPYSLSLVSSYRTDLYRFISNWIFFMRCPSHHPSQTTKHLSSSRSCCCGLFKKTIFLLSKKKKKKESLGENVLQCHSLPTKRSCCVLLMETGEGEKYESGFCPAFTGVSPLAPLFFLSFFLISGELSGLEWRTE